MRAPGKSSGSFALESAMDELAYATGLHPIELRPRNYAEFDPTRKSRSRANRCACYQVGADAIGWRERTASIRSMRDGRDLIGMGMATAAYPTHRSEAAAVARIFGDGSAGAASAGVDLGTGSYTAFTQIIAETLGLPLDRVRFELGDSSLPKAPSAGGSQLTASIGSALRLALDALANLAALAVADQRASLYGLAASDLDARAGRLFERRDPSHAEDLGTIVERNGGSPVEGRADAKPGAEQNTYSMHAFGAQFAIVRVDPDLGTVRMVTQVGVFASGRIVKAKTARSQYLGGMVFGVGMGLLEQTFPDVRTGRFMNANLGQYLVPVHEEMGTMDALIIPEEDTHVSEIGVKGIGEIGIVGAAAAIANAVYHATGTRIRDLPISPEQVLGSTT